MKILNFEILRQTILLLLLLLVAAFEVSVAKPEEEKNCPPSSIVKSVMLIEKRTSKMLEVKEKNNNQVVLSYMRGNVNELYMFTLPLRNGGQFLLYDPRSERFICRQLTRNKKQKRNFIAEMYPNLNRCSFTESVNPAVTGYVQYKVGKNNYLLHKRNYYSRKNYSCSCPKVDFHDRMVALKNKRKGRRHQHLHTILNSFTVGPNDRKRCEDWKRSVAKKELQTSSDSYERIFDPYYDV